MKTFVCIVTVFGVFQMIQLLSMVNSTLLRFLYKTGWTTNNPNLEESPSIWILYGCMVLITMVVVWLINKKEN